MRISKRLLLAGAVALVAARRELLPKYDLTGKNVLITGGSRGLGLALAREFLARGARLTLMARTKSELEQAAAHLRELGAEVAIAVGDVTKPEDCKAAVQTAVDAFGTLDVVVNNAGIIQVGPVQDMAEEDWLKTMRVNAYGPLEMSLAAHPHLKRSGGRILIVSSVGGKVAVPHLAPYSMSKFASAGLGQALRAEYARDGISVTTVCPTLMQTGSPKNATVYGDHEAEYTWFATLDNLPLVAMPADNAAKQIVDSLVRGDAEAMIGLPAQALRYAQALAPQLTADLMQLTNRVLPAPTGSTQAKKGKDSESEFTRSLGWKADNEQRYNQRGK